MLTMGQMLGHLSALHIPSHSIATATCSATKRASSTSKGSMTPESSFSALNRKRSAGLGKVQISGCHAEEPQGKIPTLKELAETGPTRCS